MSISESMMPRKLPEFCYDDFIPLDKTSAELYACHLKCYYDYRDCSSSANTWEEFERCEEEYDKCFYDCCENYA